MLEKTSLASPVLYTARFVEDPDLAFSALWHELAWERRGSTPRREYYSNDIAKPYVYGQGEFAREYQPSPWHPVMRALQKQLETQTGCRFEVCFVNGYEHQRDQLGWHADDSPEMDDARPIGIVSLGAERDILFAPRTDKMLTDRLRLQHGSLCVMAPGMQDTHLHRIPKAGFDCGPRISLTFRGYVAA
jgi:alkylated DNA repair dioxygenase AlkB